MAGILETLYPQGDYLNIKANAPTRRDYNIQVNADLARNLPGGLLKDIVAPAAAATLSLPYDAIQAYQRMQRGTGIKGYYDAFMAENPFSSLGQRFVGASAPLAERLANLNLSKTLSDSIFTPAYGDIPTKEEREGLDSFNNLVSDTVMAEPNQFQDYPGDKNLGSVQDQNLGFDYNFDENVLKEEEDAQYNLDNKGSFNMDGILQNLGGFAKNTAGRYIGSQALGGAGGMLFGPIGGLVGGIIGALKGGNLFNQNTYSQQMYNNLTSQGQGYVDRLYGPGGVLQGYNQFSAFGKGALGTIANNLSKYPNMSPARRNVYLEAANKYIDSIDQSKQGYDAVTKPGTYSYDDAYINYAPPSGDGDSSGGGSQSFGDGLIQVKQLYNYG
jgi:hypothetical protein